MSWRSKVGPWVSIGVSPGVLLLGASIGARQGGVIPLLSILIGIALIAMICGLQGLIGLQEPYGQNKNLTEALPSYVGHTSQQLLSILLAVSMVGWYGFNVGLGGGALAALLQVPGFLGAMIIGVPVILIAIGGMRMWNALTVLTSLSAFALIILVTTTITGSLSGLSATSGALPVNNLFLDVGGFLGYIAVFGTRAPDFTAGLKTPRDLVICIAFLCVPVLVMAVVGISLQAATGSTDLISILVESDLRLGNLFLAMSIIGAAFTTVYSGSLALRKVLPVPSAAAMMVIGIPGLVLAILRFDQYLVTWLTVLAAILPPVAVAMMVETVRRRAGLSPSQVPLWTWGPGALIAVAMVIPRVPAGVFIGLVVSLALSIFWSIRTG